MINGGDLYERAKILGHGNIKMTERYAKLRHKHIKRTGTGTGTLALSTVQRLLADPCLADQLRDRTSTSSV